MPPSHIRTVCAAALLVLASGAASAQETPANANSSSSLGDMFGGFVNKLKNDLSDAAKSIRDNANAPVTPTGPSTPPPGLRLKDTKLNKLFAAYPNDGSKPSPRFNGEAWFPRVALIPVSVPNEHRMGWGSDRNIEGKTVINGQVATTYNPYKVGKVAFDHICWRFRAKIWTTPTKSEDVPDFLYCADDAAATVAQSGTPPDSILTHIWMSKTQSGSLFTQGPRQPQRFASRKFMQDTDGIAGNYNAVVMLALMQQMGIDPYDVNEGNRVWVADADFIVQDF